MRMILAAAAVLMVGLGCNSVPEPVRAQSLETQLTSAQIKEEKQAPTKGYKRKIAVGRFTNETNYGKALLSDAEYGRIGRQVADMLANRLVRSGAFMVFEKPDLDEPTPVMLRADVRVQTNEFVERGAVPKVTGSFEDYIRENQLSGVDTLIVGSVTEFGRSVRGKAGFMSSKKIQTARAKVEVRMIDVHTGQAYFSASGVGEATSQAKEVAGFGDKASYDATLNDRALGAAISDMMTDIISRLKRRPWHCAVLKVDQGTVYISGGQRQGVAVGDKLAVMARGEKVPNPQTGKDIYLPASAVADVEVLSLFGEDDFSEGAVCKVLSGNCSEDNIANYFVSEAQ